MYLWILDLKELLRWLIIQLRCIIMFNALKSIRTITVLTAVEADNLNHYFEDLMSNFLACGS